MAPRDFKSRPARGSKAAPKSRPGWLYFLLGAVTGGALTAFFYLNELVPVPLYVAPEAPPATLPSGESKRRSPAAESPKPRFEFYTMLPEMEVAVPDHELSRPPASGEASQQSPPAAGSYYLQVGSFRLPEEADKMKANLAFLGLEASIQTVTINGRDTWHRVRVGPYSDLASLNESRARLREHDVETMVLKVRN